MEAKRKRMKLGIVMLACLLVGILAQVLQPTVPLLSQWENRAVWQTEFDPEAGQTYAEFVVMRETYIVERAVEWLVEADTTLRTTFRSIILSAISTIAVVVFLICLALMVIGALIGIKRKIVSRSVSS